MAGCRTFDLMTDPALPSPAALRAPLLDFFDTRARNLPWRKTGDPYSIWVSEVMLQQTRVETVIPYWERWLEAFPDVDALAGAEEEEVLKLWEGLGYYSRARNLRRGAMVVRERFGGELPETVEALREVPGIGPYTSGAIASIAFGVATPAVDGNVRRVLARLYDEPAPTAAWLRERAGDLVDPDRPGDFNQALMELGATICTPKSPNCTGCPVATLCAAFAAGTQLERPAPKKRAPIPHRIIPLVVAVRSTPGGWQVAMRKRPTDGLLGGMWEFPEWEGTGDSASHHAEADPLPEVEHVFSHFRATYRPFVTEVPDSADIPVEHSEQQERRWLFLPEIDQLPLPVAQQKIAVSLRGWLADRSPGA